MHITSLAAKRKGKHFLGGLMPFFGRISMGALACSLQNAHGQIKGSLCRRLFARHTRCRLRVLFHHSYIFAEVLIHLVKYPWQNIRIFMWTIYGRGEESPDKT